MEATVNHSKDGAFPIPDELKEAYLLDSGLSFMDIRLAPAHLIDEYMTLKHLQGIAEKAQQRKAKH